MENSGAKGARTRIIVVGRVRIDHLFLAIAVTSVPYPFRPQMAKVHLRIAFLVSFAVVFMAIMVRAFVPFPTVVPATTPLSPKEPLAFS